MNENAATLYVVATPIGNLEDLSPRARQTLADVDLIAAEDTRHTRRLLTHFGIRTPLFALHEHNEAAAAAELVRRLRRGESVALVSDAGTPLISDPGYRFVAAAAEAGVRIATVPGPSAAVAALSISGLPTDSFVFAGFLPARPAARRRALEDLEGESRTIVLYESVHRCGALLEDVVAVLGGERSAALARELTKRHESVYRGTAGELSAAWSSGEIVARGEFVLCLGGATGRGADDAAAERVLRLLMKEELPLKTAARLAAEITGVARNRLYRRAMDLKASGGDEDGGEDA